MEARRATPSRVGLCVECGFDWDSQREVVLAGFGPAVDLVRAGWSAAEVLGADRLRTRPADGVWAPIEYLGHIRDACEFFEERIGLVIEVQRPVLHVPAGGFAAMVENADRSAADPLALLAEITASVDRVRSRLAGLSAAQWQRAGVGSSGEDRTVLDLAKRMLHELMHHGADLAPGQ